MSEARVAIMIASSREAYAAVTCAFCRRHRRQVVLLIVCGEAAICNECLVAAQDAAIEAALAIDARRRNGHAPPLVGSDPYTGEICDQCGGLRMVRTGTCSTCLDCGSSGGCA